MRIGIVISNHAAEEWTEKALREQYKLDDVRYYQHPDIDPRANRTDVWKLALAYLFEHGILRDVKGLSYALMEGLVVASINGEYGFSTACVHHIKRAGYSVAACVYPTSERGATEEKQKDGSIKTVHVYKFVQFREW